MIESTSLRSSVNNKAYRTIQFYPPIPTIRNRMKNVNRRKVVPIITRIAGISPSRRSTLTFWLNTYTSLIWRPGRKKRLPSTTRWPSAWLPGTPSNAEATTRRCSNITEESNKSSYNSRIYWHPKIRLGLANTYWLSKPKRLILLRKSINSGYKSLRAVCSITWCSIPPQLALNDDFIFIYFTHHKSLRCVSLLQHNA